MCSVLLAFVSFGASAIQWEIGAGQAYAQKAEDGIYYQERFPHKHRLQGQVFTFGVTDKFTVFGRDTRWRIFGVYMDGLGGDAEAVQDEQYSPYTASGCVPAGCGTFSRYRSELSTRGIAATIAPEFVPFTIAGKPLIVSPEIGIHAYLPRMDEDVYTLDGNSTASSYRYYHYKHGWNMGEVYGIGAEWGNVRLTFRRYKINMVNRGTTWQTDMPSPVGEIVNTVSLDWRF